MKYENPILIPFGQSQKTKGYCSAGSSPGSPPNILLTGCVCQPGGGPDYTSGSTTMCCPGATDFDVAFTCCNSGDAVLTTCTTGTTEAAC